MTRLVYFRSPSDADTRNPFTDEVIQFLAEAGSLGPADFGDVVVL